VNSLGEAADIAIESTGHWYCLVDEMEKADHQLHLTQPNVAKKMMGKTNKTEALDAKVWPSFCVMEHCRRYGFHLGSFATSASC